jgi:anti-sigma factor RsiW
MHCREIRERISAYMDHELDAKLSHRIERHLDHCTACREVFDDFQSLDAMLRGLPRFDPGSDFARQIVMKVSGSVTVDDRRSSRRLPVLARLGQLIEDLMDLFEPAASPSTHALDEFHDFPPLSMGYIYFKLVDLPVRG